MPHPIEEFWQAYLATLPPDDPAREAGYVAEPFGDNPELADELAELVLAGTKTATCSCLWEWEADGDPLPPVGLKTVVLSGREDPLCIIETTSVETHPFNQVAADFAAAEGEGDRSLAYWREAHWRYFSRVLPKIGRTPSETMPLVCERFRLIYPQPKPQ